MDSAVRKAGPDHFPIQIQSGGLQISVGAFIQFSWKAVPSAPRNTHNTEELCEDSKPPVCPKHGKKMSRPKPK